MLAQIFDRLSVVIGAIVFCQFPAFLQQYSQRLGGHLAEVSRQVAEIQALAQLSGKTVPDYVTKFLLQPDADMMRQGVFMQQLIERRDLLSDALIQLQRSSAWMRPFSFLRYAQVDVVQGTWAHFEPALAFIAESMIYALLGMVIGYGVYALLRFGVTQLISRLRFRGREHPETAS